MKTLTTICVVSATMMGMGMGAQVMGADLTTNINPALLYYQAFIEAPNLENADYDYLYNFTNSWRGEKLAARYGETVARFDTEFKLVRQAAQQEAPCDWGIDLLSSGPATLLPHLPRAKQVAQVTQCRAVWDLQQGNQADARADLLAEYVLGRNVSRDGTLIGVLVEHAMEAILYGTVAQNFGQFSPETLKELVDGFDAAPAEGTMAAAIMTEKWLYPGWLVNKIQKLQRENPGNDAKVLEAIHDDDELQGFQYVVYDNSGGKQDSNVWQRVLAASGGTSDGVLKLVRDLDPWYARLARIMTLPLPEYGDQMQKFAAEIGESPNPLVQIVFPALTNARSREFRVQAEQAMVRAAVEYKLHGVSGLQSVMDPLGNGPFAFQRFIFEGVDRGFRTEIGLYLCGSSLCVHFCRANGKSVLR